MTYIRTFLLISVLCSMIIYTASLPDSGYVPPPGPGLSYGGIPYGSMSGNVAEFFNRQAPSSGRTLSLVANPHINNIDFAPIEQYL